jgi:hypothetical protein
MSRRILTIHFIAFLLFILISSGITGARKFDLTLSGKINVRTKRVKVTEAATRRETSAGSIETAIRSLNNKGYEADAVKELEFVLNEGIKTLESKRSVSNTPFKQRGSLDDIDIFRHSNRASLVEMGLNGDQFYFKVFTDDARSINSEVRGIKEQGGCEKMNDKCFICSDNKIHCLTRAIEKRVR